MCKRTLRKQVLEYIRYTNRHALVQEFVPSDDEQRLYELVSDYLQRPTSPPCRQASATDDAHAAKAACLVDVCHLRAP